MKGCLRNIRGISNSGKKRNPLRKKREVEEDQIKVKVGHDADLSSIHEGTQSKLNAS